MAITIDLKIGLGNMLFQIAFIESFSKANKTTCYYYNIIDILNKTNEDTIYCPDLKHAFDYINIFKNLNLMKNLNNNFKTSKSIPFEYVKVEFIDNCCYKGYFQSTKYFNEDLIKELFVPNDDLNYEIGKIYNNFNSRNICSIHIRRGDYVRLKDQANIHPTITIDYIKNAMNMIKSDLYLVFSDDIGWAKENLKGNEFVFVDGQKDYYDMLLMSRCNNNIISNSTFSWWGAYLNKNDKKMVIAPEKWFGNSKYSSKDIIPRGWIII